jgi:crotonobetainyl-CoA:carnitine CoA-transferase CaiB-like acyl-CoA transferase
MLLPLTGIRVVDFSRVLAGPHCAKTLLDLGADVVKVEPPSGDLSRKAFLTTVRSRATTRNRTPESET